MQNKKTVRCYRRHNVSTTRCYKYLLNPEDTDENPLTKERLMNWLADTGWVEGHIRKQISPLDVKYTEDYIQEVWLQILEVPEEKIMSIWYKGKGKFTNYIKAIIMNNIYSNSSHLYRNIRAGQENVYHLDEVGWKALESDQDTYITHQYPVASKEEWFERAKFETQTIHLSSEINQSEYDNDFQEK